MENNVKKILKNNAAPDKLPPAFGTLPQAFIKLRPAFGKISEPEASYRNEEVAEAYQGKCAEEPKMAQSILPVVISDVNKCRLSAKGMNFSIQLVGVKELVKEETDGERRRTIYKFLITLGSDEYMQEVDATDLENFSWVKKATVGRAYIEGTQGGSAFKRLIHEALETGLTEIEREIYYLQNGWKRLMNGSFVYVCNHGIVGQPNRLIHGCDELQFQIDSDVTAFQNFQDFMGMQEITCRPEFTRCFMVFTSLSVMASLFEKAGFPVKFVLGVLGTTNTMKTSVSLVFTTIFNALKPQKPEVTFSSTKNGIETMVSRYSDGILLVDDFMPADSKKKQAELNGKLELICRLYGDRTSKKRMLDFCDKKVDYPVRGCCVFTGEHLTGVESSRTRILVLKLERGDVQTGELSFFQKNPLILPTYLYGFIAYLQQNVEQVMKLIAQSVSAYREAANYKIARLNETQAVLSATVDIMANYWKEVGFISCDCAIENKWKSSIAKIVSDNDRRLSEVSVSEVIINALIEKIYQSPQDCKPLEEIQKSDRGKIYFDDSFFYVRAEDLYIATKEYCSKYDYDFYLQKQMIIEKMKEADILETQIDEKGHECAARKLKQGKGVTARFLFLKRKKIEDENR